MEPPQVLVVAYGCPGLLDDALGDVASLRVVVVDNSSSHEVEEVAGRHGAIYVDPGSNLGFAAGVNRGLQEISAGHDVLLLNPDARIGAAAVGQLQERLHRPGSHLAAVAPAQRDGHGAWQRVEWPIPSPALAWAEALGLHLLPWFRSRRGQHFLTGSILLLNAEALHDVGHFDERFFLYSEETDWQRRAADHGWAVELASEVTGFHLGAATSGDEQVRETHFHASGERFIRKWYGDRGWTLYRVAVILGALLRGAMLGGDRAVRSRRRARLFLLGPLKAELHLPSR